MYIFPSVFHPSSGLPIHPLTRPRTAHKERLVCPFRCMVRGHESHDMIFVCGAWSQHECSPHPARIKVVLKSHLGAMAWPQKDINSL